MKKFLSVLLSVIMLVCCIPFAASAEGTVTFDTTGVFAASDQLVTGNNYVILSGVTMTVPSNLTLYLPTGAKLYVEQGGRLVVNGSIITVSGSQLYVDGTVTGASNISGQGDCYAQLRFPALADVGLAGRISVSYAFSESGSAYDNLNGTLTYTAVPDAGSKVYLPLNQYAFIKAVITEPDTLVDKYDDALMNVSINGVGVPYAQGSHNVKIENAGDISYSRWVSDDAFLNTFSIYLPTGEGYTVYGREGEQSALGETVKLKYGQPFSFKVEIEPEFDMSTYEVYIYNGYGWTNLDTTELLKDIEPAKPDEYGYYNIPKVEGDTTIYVIGVVKNSTLTLVGDILDMIRNVFEMIKSFFEQLFGVFTSTT